MDWYLLLSKLILQAQQSYCNVNNVNRLNESAQQNQNNQGSTKAGIMNDSSVLASNAVGCKGFESIGDCSTIVSTWHYRILKTKISNNILNQEFVDNGMKRNQQININELRCFDNQKREDSNEWGHYVKSLHPVSTYQPSTPSGFYSRCSLLNKIFISGKK